LLVDRPLTEVGLLGVLQGLTEFLPVSSSGHLALAELLFGLSDASLTLNVLLHAGTLLATALVLRRQLQAAVVDGFRALRCPARLRETPGGRDALFVVTASAPTAVVGVLLRDAVSGWTCSALAVALGFAMTTALLISTRHVRAGAAPAPTVAGALLIGLAQGIAVIPGVSRSGATIVAAMWLGVRPQRAFELSMLASVPAVAGAMLVEAPAIRAAGVTLAGALAGAGLAFGVGLGALVALRGATVRGRLSWFGWWTAAAAVAGLAVALRG
jgi:undecaprenyl-diphosphatase